MRNDPLQNLRLRPDCEGILRGLPSYTHGLNSGFVCEALMKRTNDFWGMQTLPIQGFQAEWDSNGGSLHRGTLSMRNRQWPWFAILARTGRERNATLLLENAGYECYLPVSKSIRRWSDRTKHCEVPLFPGYFFCRMDPNNRLPVLMVQGVIQIVGTGKTPVPVDEEEIAAIQRAGKSELPTMPWPYMEVGHVAQIMEGPLRGLNGIVVKIKSGTKLVLSVNLLKRSVAVEIDSGWISEPAPVGSVTTAAKQFRQADIQISPTRLTAAFSSKTPEAS